MYIGWVVVRLVFDERYEIPGSLLSGVVYKMKIAYTGPIENTA